MPRHSYESAARWTGKRCGVVECDQTAAGVAFCAPAEFQGEAGRWTPEHLLLSAVAACFVATFRAIAEASRFDMAALEVSATGTLGNKDGGFEFDEIILHPILSISSEQQRERALGLLNKTEHACLISRSLKTPIRMKPLVEVLSPAAAESAAVAYNAAHARRDQ